MLILLQKNNSLPGNSLKEHIPAYYKTYSVVILRANNSCHTSFDAEFEALQNGILC